MANTVCSTCSGVGKKPCPNCGGKGKTSGFLGLMKRTCTQCDGGGEIPCPNCGGVSPRGMTPCQFDLPDGHTSIYRTHDVSNDSWHGCELEFTNQTMRATLSQGDDSVKLWDFEIHEVPLGEYNPGRFKDWQPRPDYCECSYCRNDQPGKLRVESFRLERKFKFDDDAGWLTAVENAVPQPLGYWLYETTFQGRREGGAKTLFVVARFEDVGLLDEAGFEERLSAALLPITERGQRRNIDGSGLEVSFGELDRYEKVLVGSREPEAPRPEGSSVAATATPSYAYYLCFTEADAARSYFNKIRERERALAAQIGWKARVELREKEGVAHPYWVVIETLKDKLTPFHQGIGLELEYDDHDEGGPEIIARNRQTTLLDAFDIEPK